MRAPVTLTFHDIERTGALEARMREVAERLRRHHDDITHCHITVEDRLDGGPERASCVAKIHLSLPGAQIHADSIGPERRGSSGRLYRLTRRLRERQPSIAGPEIGPREIESDRRRTLNDARR